MKQVVWLFVSLLLSLWPRGMGARLMCRIKQVASSSLGIYSVGYISHPILKESFSGPFDVL